jgi:hypothetical protein
VTAFSTIVTVGQLRVLADMMEPRTAAVLQAFGLQQAGQVEAFIHQDPAQLREVLFVKVPFRRREAV